MSPRADNAGHGQGRAGSFLAGYVSAVIDHPLLTLAAVGFVTALLTLQTRHLRVSADPDALLPLDHPFVRLDRKLRETFGGRNFVLIMVRPRTGTIWQPRVLRAVHSLTHQLRLLPGVNPASIMSIAAPAARYLHTVGSRLAIDYLMREPPESPEAIAALRARVRANPLYRDLLVTPDERGAIVTLDFFGNPSAAAVATAVESVCARLRSPDLEIAVTGEPILMHALNAFIRDTRWRLGLAIPVTVAVLYLVFRSLQGALLPLLTALLSIGWAMGLAGLAGFPIDSYTAMSPVLILALAAGHSTQVVKRYYEELATSSDNRLAVERSLTRIGPVMVAAGLTAALGFGSLALFRLPSYRTFGILIGLGILSALVLELSFIPALRLLLPPPGRSARAAGRLDRWLTALADHLARAGGKPILVVTAALGLIALLGAARVRGGYRFTRYVPDTTRGKRDLVTIRKAFPGVVTFIVLFEGSGAPTDPRVAQAVAGLESLLATQPIVYRAASYLDILEYARRLIAAGEQQDGAEARGRYASRTAVRASKPLPSTGTHAARPSDLRLALLAKNRPLLTQLMFLVYSTEMERFVDRGFGKVALWAFLRRDDAQEVRTLVARAQRFITEHPPGKGIRVSVAGGVGPLVAAIDEVTTGGKVKSIVLLLPAIGTVAAVILGSALGGLLVVIPLLFSVLAIFGFLGWAGLPLDPVTATISAMAAGIGADYAIYLLFRLRESYREWGDLTVALHTTLLGAGEAIVCVALAIGAGYGTLAFAPFWPFRLSGLLVPLAMVASCGAALTILPALVVEIRPRFVVGSGQLERKASAGNTC